MLHGRRTQQSDNGGKQSEDTDPIKNRVATPPSLHWSKFLLDRANLTGLSVHVDAHSVVQTTDAFVSPWNIFTIQCALDDSLIWQVFVVFLWGQWKTEVKKRLITVDKSRILERLQPEDGTFVCLGYYLFRVWVHMHLQIRYMPRCKGYDSIYCKKEWFIVSYACPLGLHTSMNAMSSRQTGGGFESEAV